MSKKTVGIVVGSLRRGSFCKMVADELSCSLEKEFVVKFIDIAGLALYNEDLDNESDIPEEWKRLREDVGSVDAVLFVTPEYNRSMPPLLKNALDVASRPYGSSKWNGKPGAVVSVSPGAMGGFGANHQLRQTAAFLNILMMQQPEAYIGGIAGAVGADGVTDENLKGFLSQVAGAYISWVHKLTA